MTVMLRLERQAMLFPRDTDSASATHDLCVAYCLSLKICRICLSATHAVLYLELSGGCICGAVWILVFSCGSEWQQYFVRISLTTTWSYTACIFRKQSWYRYNTVFSQIWLATWCGVIMPFSHDFFIVCPYLTFTVGSQSIVGHYTDP